MKSALAASLCLLLPSASAVRPPGGNVARTLRTSPARRARPWGMHHPPLPSRLSSIRGGALLEEYDESDDDLISDVESDEEELSDAELSNLEVDEEAAETEEEEPAAAAAASGPPVKLSIKTALQSELIDQRLEFTASRKRTVLSLRQAVAKTMRGRPPLSCVVLKHHGRTLDDEETVDDILEDVDEDDEEESDAEDDIGEEEDTVKVGLTCDIVPPVDAKFGIELREKAGKLSTRELVEAYCANMAGMVYGQELQAKEEELYEREEAGASWDNQERGDEEGADGEAPPPLAENHSLEIRKRAARIQRQFEGTLSAETRQLIEEEHARIKEATSASDESGEAIYGLAPHSSLAARSARKGRTLKGGAAMNIKRTLQRNLNVHWADTFRNSLLFLFFGYFGGRNSFSRTFLLLGSPLCFFLQTRPVKVAMKRVFYTVGEPPGILLSLLPAPQQAIMSLDYGGAMRGLYGEQALEGEAWTEAERAEDDDEGFGGGWGLDEDEDEYGDDEGYDAEYDSDDEY